MKKQILLFNGSTRKSKTSFSFARTIKSLAEKEGHTVEIVNVIDYFNREKNLEDVKPIIFQSDIIGLISPLYVDSLPYPVIWFLESLSSAMAKELRDKDFFAIGQCGFPDISMNQPLLESCRLFSQAVDMKWLGGLSYGGGAMLDGALLETLGKKGEKITLAFKLALDDILQGKRISSKPQELLTVKIPKILNRPLALFLNHSARKEAKRRGITDITRRVYLE